MAETTFLTWSPRVLGAVNEVSGPGRPASFATIGTAMGLGPEALTWELAAQGGTAAHALTTALSDLDAVGQVAFETVVGGAAVTQSGRDALDRGLAKTWAGWWDDTHLAADSLAFLRRLAHASEQRSTPWADLAWVDAADIWRENGPPLEREDIQDWQRVLEVVGDLRDKELLIARIFGGPSVTLRVTMKGMVRAMPDHPMSPSRRTGILDWVDPLPDWDREELALQGLIASLAAATDVEDYKNVGRRARDLFDQVASKVFDRSMAPTGQDAPGASDGKRMLDYYFKHQLRGASNKELRDFARSLDALANHLTHAENMGRVKAFVSVQGLVMLVRMIQEIQRQREPQDFWLAPD